MKLLRIGLSKKSSPLLSISGIKIIWRSRLNLVALV
nr:MAG TPA: hypothetical protein [Caudoviricetes sp.]